MKLTKISYASAVFFAALTFISTLITGIIVAAAPQLSAQIGIPTMTYLQALSATVTQTIGVYVGIVFAIAIYNLVARKYPVSWEIKK
jgi:hypothetical protein